MAPNTGTYNPNSGGQINIPGAAQGLLSLAGNAPGPAGFAATGANALLHAYNTAMSMNQADKIGATGNWNPLSFLGGVVGLNNRGDTGGNATVAAPGQWTNPLNGEQPAVTQQGLYDNSPFGFLARMFSPITSLFGGSGMFDPTGAKTVAEAMRANAMGGFGNNAANALAQTARVNNAYGLVPGTASLAGPAVVAGDQTPAGYQVYTGNLKNAPAGIITKNGINYAPQPNATGGNGAFINGSHPFNSSADVGFGAGNYASSTGAPSGPAVTSGAI